MNELAECVARGAALLDERRPGWAAEIALDRLAMADCSACILGQLYGSFSLGECSLALGIFDPIILGFDISNHRASSPAGPALFAELAALWRAEVARRLEVPRV